VADARGTPGDLANLLQQPRQHALLGIPTAEGIVVGHPEVDDGDPLEGVADVDHGTDGPGAPVFLMDGEQRLHFRHPGHLYPQPAVVFYYFGNAVALDRRLNRVSHPVLAGVEEQQRLERAPHRGRQA
jgi:hypothetical protein